MGDCLSHCLVITSVITWVIAWGLEVGTKGRTTYFVGRGGRMWFLERDFLAPLGTGQQLVQGFFKNKTQDLDNRKHFIDSCFPYSSPRTMFLSS